MTEEPFDWSKASAQDRRELYAVVRSLVGSGRLTMADLFRQALSIRPGVDYEANFRKGTIGRARAAQIARFIGGRFPDAADDLVDRLRRDGPTPGITWRALLDRHAQFGAVNVQVQGSSLPVVEIAPDAPVAALRIALHERFCFELRLPHSGTMLALQGHAGLWHCLPLARDRTTIYVEAGTLLLPRSQDGTPLTLVERDDAGLHEFVFVIGADDAIRQLVPHGITTGRPVASRFLDDTASALERLTDWQVHQINIRFSRG